MNKEYFGSIKGVVEIKKDLEVKHFVVEVCFDLFIDENTKKESPAEEIKYLLKVMVSLVYYWRLASYFLILLPLI